MHINPYTKNVTSQMKKNIILILLIINIRNFSQEISFNQIKEQYEAFEYEKVIQLSTLFIKQSGISDSVKIEVYQMRVVAFYSLGDEASTQNSFREILKINKNYQPDPSKISPRLIAIFQTVKEDYLKFLRQNTVTKDTSLQSTKFFSPDQLRSSVLKNLLVPGWGQISNGYSTKGYLLSIASSGNLLSMVYFIFDSKKKENEYLKEINKNLIPSKYDSYNKAYKWRNILITSYILLWVYSQVDLLLFSNGSELNQSDTEVTFINPQQIQFSLRIPISF